MRVAGAVAGFDAERGDGWIQGDDGVNYYFHCVSIADGSRIIDNGKRVSGKRSVGRLGRDELVEVAPRQ